MSSHSARQKGDDRNVQGPDQTGAKAFSKRTEDGDELKIKDLEAFENVACIMAYHAEPFIPRTIDEYWLYPFGMLSIDQTLPQILELWGDNLVTEVEAKKGLAEVNGR